MAERRKQMTTRAQEYSWGSGASLLAPWSTIFSSAILAIAALVLLMSAKLSFSTLIGLVGFGFFGSATLFLLSPLLSISNSHPVLTISSNGLHDRRQTTYPIPWDDIAWITHSSNGLDLSVKLRPESVSSIRRRIPYSWLPKSTEITVLLTTLDTTGRSPIQDCYSQLRARSESLNATAITFLKSISGGKITASNARAFANAIRKVAMLHPTMERTSSHHVNIIADDTGNKRIHVFLNKDIYELTFPGREWDRSYATLYDLIKLARKNDINDIVVEPGEPHQIVINSALFDLLEDL